MPGKSLPNWAQLATLFYDAVVAIALLTPVPLEHLVDGREVCAQEGRVAFGSQAWEVFRELDREGGPGTLVLIYASHSGALGRPRVTWSASYHQYVESRGGAHPERSRIRPPSTITDTVGYWAGFYELKRLELLSEDEEIAIRNLSDRAGRRYARDFVPEGPMIITEP